MFTGVSYVDKGFAGYWDETLEKIGTAAPQYSAPIREYDRIYIGERLVADLSFVVLDADGKGVAAAPLYLCQNNGSRDFSYLDTYLYAPIFLPHELDPARKKLMRFVFQHIEALAIRHGAGSHLAAIPVIEHFSGLTYHNYLLRYGYDDHSTASNIIDLALTDDALWHHIRRRYKPLINKSEREYAVKTIDSKCYNLDDCERYRALHLKAAGRVTRPIETFHKAYEMIRDGRAYLVGVSKDGNWLGAYLFTVYHNNVYYASGATDPALPANCGVGHLGMWTAITYARSCGCRYFEIGHTPLQSETGMNEKERNIALFKSGFGGRTVSWFRGKRTFIKNEPE